MVNDEFYELVEQVTRDLYIQALKDVPPDVRDALSKAIDKESSPTARRLLQTMFRALELSDEEDMIVCQDTGLPVYWVSIGKGLCVDGPRLQKAIDRGTERATTEHPFRSSIVSPLGRENRQTSTGKRMPYMHIDFTDEHDDLEILIIPKGSGSENMSFLNMLVPADGVLGIKKFILDCVIEAAGKTCPPSVVGVGIGGTADQCVYLAKLALTRAVGSHNSDPAIATMEDELLEVINQTGIGPMGLGGDTTSLAVHIEDAWTHITMNPVAVNLQCWRGLRRRAYIHTDATVDYDY
jgi:tartrate/fumarate subfamily iron-sulfur-dependent hydro-lyase alpha chain